MAAQGAVLLTFVFSACYSGFYSCRTAAKAVVCGGPCTVYPSFVSSGTIFVFLECVFKTGTDAFVWTLGQLSIGDGFVFFLCVDRMGANLVS